jgi:hypothetical protein
MVGVSSFFYLDAKSTCLVKELIFHAAINILKLEGTVLDSLFCLEE